MIRAALRTSTTVAGWPIEVRYFWALLWGYCDDYGRGLYDSRVIVGDTFPYDEDVTADTIANWMQTLENDGVIRRYEASGRTFFECVNWDEHQNLRYQKKPKAPPPPWISQNSETFRKISREEKGKRREVEEKGKGEGVTAPPPFCGKHPGGTDDPCRACGNARRARAAWDETQKTKPSPSHKRPRAGDGHTCVDDGYGWCATGCGKKLT